MEDAPPPSADWVGAVLSAGVAGSSATQQLQLNSTQATTSLTNIRRLILDHGAEAVARDLAQHVQNTSPLACKVGAACRLWPSCAVCCVPSYLSLLLFQSHLPGCQDSAVGPAILSIQPHCHRSRRSSLCRASQPALLPAALLGS
jgi:hypothetical protein